MDVQTALNLIKEVCGKYLGTLTDHQNLQIAISVLEASVKSAEPAPKPEKPAAKQK